MRPVGLAVVFAALGCGRAPDIDRAKVAEGRATPLVVERSMAAKLNHPPRRIYIRAFKEEKELEIWGAEKVEDAMVLIATYPIARMSGGIGPKRKESDLQVPEGLYVIDRFNPKSQFHLSLGVNYPNASDLIRSDHDNPGFDIFIHGSTVSIGCLAMTDPVIEEIWVFATTARVAGQKSIPVHIFPARLTETKLKSLESMHSEPAFHQLWKELKPFYDAFEADRRVPKFTVGEDGSYTLVRNG